MSATVVRSVQVSVSEESSGFAALHVQMSDGAAWEADVMAAAGVPGVGVSRSSTDPSYLVVTVLADAPLPAGAVAPPRRLEVDGRLDDGPRGGTEPSGIRFWASGFPGETAPPVISPVRRLTPLRFTDEGQSKAGRNACGFSDTPARAT